MTRQEALRDWLEEFQPGPNSQWRHAVEEAIVALDENERLRAELVDLRAVADCTQAFLNLIAKRTYCLVCQVPRGFAHSDFCVCASTRTILNDYRAKWRKEEG